MVIGISSSWLETSKDIPDHEKRWGGVEAVKETFVGWDVSGVAL